MNTACPIDRAIELAIRTLSAWSIGDPNARLILGLNTDPGRITQANAERASAIIRIELALRRVFVDPARRRFWMSQPNANFAGMSPLAFINQPDLTPLLRLQKYLEAEAQGW